ASTGVALPRPSVPDSEEDEDVASPSAATTAEAYAAPSRWDPDGFSWPLPLSIIKGGRYRVEAVVSVAADETGENGYRVRDLQGYERCWSCGAEYGATNAPNTYCNQCGADLLAREYLMYERRQVASNTVDEPSSEPGASGVPAAAEARALDPNSERTFVE